MTTFYLVRHAHFDLLDKVLVGRQSGVHLNHQGRKAAAVMADRLLRGSVNKVVSSPLDRALETAQIIAERSNVEVEVNDNFNEIDLGSWSGRELRSLESDPAWRQFNSFRTGSRPPGGESMIEVQTRFVVEMTELARKHPDETLVIVSHSDPIKTALVYWTGMPLDFFHRLEIRPCSFSVVTLDKSGPRVLSINNVCDS